MTLVRVLWAIMGLLLLVGLIVLATWGIPAPSMPIEKVIPLQKISE